MKFIRQNPLRSAPLLLLCVLFIPACGENGQVLVSGSGYVLSTSTVAFAAVQGAGNPPDQRVILIGPLHYRRASAGWTATSNQSWLTVSPSSGTTGAGLAVPLTLSVQVPLPQAESWIGATSTLNAASPREDHDAAWTGSRMVLWGGEINGTKLNTGGLYDPATGQWTGSTSTVGAPSVRTLHTLVWTGSNVLVWGGSTGAAPSPLSTYYGDGFLYSPTADAWLGTISTVNAPSPRSFHSAVWAGTRMIVWGGYDGTTLVNTGGIYEPATDTWIGSTTPTNAPTPRLHHVAAWTGTEMIVWGGQDATGNVNDGKRYDPVLDQWTPISSTGAPTARQAATAVWTGSEMVVWGGNDGSGSVNTGGRYDPVTDAWAGATTTTGAPTGRQSHSAVWTGSRMVVSHGASSTGVFTDTGGIYQPPVSGLGTYTATVLIQPAGAPPMSILVTLTITP